jgi:hypothetical protein
MGVRGICFDLEDTVSERRKMRAGHRLQLVERNEGKARIAQPTGAQF